jgi:Ca-activated chloride channel family protein
MSLIWPVLLVALLVVPLLVAWYIWALHRRRPVGVRYSSLSLVREAVPRSSRIRRHLPFALFALALATLAIGLARPVVAVPVPSGQATVILAMDVSRSMCQRDIEPSRLHVAKDAASAFIERQGSSFQIGVVAFAGFGELVQPPTDDQQLLLDAVRGLTTGRRTAIGSAILESIDAIAEVDEGVPPSTTPRFGEPGLAPPPAMGMYVPHVIVLLTDGVSNVGPQPEEAARQAVERGIRVFTIGFGTADPGDNLPVCSPQLLPNQQPVQQFSGGPGGGAFRRGIDEETLSAVSDMTGGEYYPAESAAELHSVFETLPAHLVVATEVVEVTVGFAAVGLLLAGLALLLAQWWRPLP